MLFQTDEQVKYTQCACISLVRLPLAESRNHSQSAYLITDPLYASSNSIAFSFGSIIFEAI